MINRTSFFRVTCFCAALLSVSLCTAAEQWADATLSVTNGLEVWLDASAQSNARNAQNLPELTENRALDVWFDGSGHHADVAQPEREARPRFHRQGARGFVRFDGESAFLSAGNLRRSFPNATVFIYANAHSNEGGFRGYLAFNATGVNDYRSGINFDLSPAGTPQLSAINAEGAGFNGMGNLLATNLAFNRFHTFTLVNTPGPDGVRLFANGVPQHTRKRNAAPLRMDELTIGARKYSNNAELPYAQGFLAGDIAEVLIYNRALADDERREVERYLSGKYSQLTDLPAGAALAGGGPVTVPKPPPVQMLIPGFTVRELPLHLPNINNLKYRADGKLYALGYNGQIWLLTDTDGDGLEDKAELFWDGGTLRAPIGMAVTPPGYPLGQGVFVPNKGRVSLIVDTNADDHADREIIVAEGWPVLVHNVDALGIALDRDGSIYFGLGCASYTNPYLVDKATGQSHFDLGSERGTIIKVSPDFKHREIICTGVRYTVGMAINRYGDLFCTDQEGATWLPNGNPLDELLHIERGRHYGFPPRHPVHLTSVIDEPSVFDYAPQHQSTCGFNFNEPVNGGPVFGPAWWAGDALITGESRGKLFRTKTVKTPAGYVAQNQVIGCLTNLTIDACVSPKGDLVVTTHSGKPDWGTGPTGTGRLWKISYTQPAAPQPVIAWPASPTEIRIAFDRPLDPALLRNLVKRITLTQGRYVQAGDRFEYIRPGYQVVEDQLATPRQNVPVLGVNISPDNRTLALRTPPLTSAMRLSVAVEGEVTTAPDKTATAANRYSGQLDLATDLSGVEVRWLASDGQKNFTGWLPHPDLQVAREFTATSAEHEQLRALLQKPGALILRGQLDLWQMLQPAIQPGAKLDWERPGEEVTVVFSAKAPFTASFAGATATPARANGSTFEARISKRSGEGAWLPFELTLPTGGKASELTAYWFTADDNRPRAFPLRRFLVPWATPKLEPVSTSTKREIPELAGGNWLHGRKVFFSETAACSKCHTLRGEGGHVGPDLSNLIFRDYASVLKDIREPSAAINPDHVAYIIDLTDSETVTGVILESDGDHLLVADASAKTQVIPKAKVKSMHASSVSLMPEGLDKALSPDQLRDLLTFLLLEPLVPAPIIAEMQPPPPRKRAEVEALMKQTAPLPAVLKPFRIVLCAGPKDHGLGEHDYPLWLTRWSKLLALADGVTVETAQNWPSPPQWQSADVVVFFSDNPSWTAAHTAELDALLARGGGLAYFHWAVDGHKDVEALAQRIGLAWRGGASKFRHGPLDLQIQPHPLAAGLNGLSLVDESYWNLVGDPAGINLVASGVEEGAPRPLIWTRTQGPGRVFVCIPGHFTWTFDDPVFRILALRGICWAAGQPMDRLAELSLIGARIE